MSYPHDPQQAQGEYAFKSPYSQASHDDGRSRAYGIDGQQPQQPSEYGMGRSTATDPDAEDDAPAASKERAELYSNTLSGTGAAAGHDYPTRSAGLGGSKTDRYADTGAGGPAGAGSAAYGRKGIWTHADRSAFQRRSTPAKVVRSVLCVLLVGIVFVVAAVLLIVTFARPPNVAIGAITSNQTVPTLGRTSLSFNMSVDISVSNPNAIAATITELEAVAYDQVRPSTAIGSGKITDVRIDPSSNTTFTLPFVVSYDSTTDGDTSLIRDIATKCGWLAGTSPSQLDFTFQINAHLSVLSLAIPFSLSVSPTFTCPISASAIQGLLGSAGGSLDGILKGLGIGSRRDLGPSSAAVAAVPRDLLDDGAESLGRDLSLRDLQFAQMLSEWRQRAALLGTDAQARSEF